LKKNRTTRDDKKSNISNNNLFVASDNQNNNTILNNFLKRGENVSVPQKNKSSIIEKYESNNLFRIDKYKIDKN